MPAPRLSRAERAARKARARYVDHTSSSAGPNRVNPRLAALLRISAGDDASTSIPAQTREVCDRAAAIPGAAFDPATDIYIDYDLTGGGTVVRDALEAIMERVRAGELDGVVVPSWDRFFRNVLLTHRVVQDMREVNCELYIVNEPSLSLFEMMGQMRLQMLAQSAEDELKAIKHRNKRGHKERARHGILRIASRPLYGMAKEYRPVDFRVEPGAFYTPDETPLQLLDHDADYSDGFDHLWTGPASKAAVVRWLAVRVAEGHKRIDLARTLNSRGIPAPGEDGWSSLAIRNLLSNAHLIGHSLHLGQALLDEDGRPKVVHTPLLSEAVFYACKERLVVKEFEPRAPQSNAWLVGFLRCTTCGGAMSSNGSGTYVCQTKYRRAGAARCAGNSISGPKMEAAVDTFMLRVLRRPELLAAARAANASQDVRRKDEEIAADIARVRTRIERLRQMKLDGDYDHDPDSYDEQMRALQAQLRSLNGEARPMATEVVDLGDDPGAKWEAATPMERALILTDFVWKIDVDPRKPHGKGSIVGRWEILTPHDRRGAVAEAA